MLGLPKEIEHWSLTTLREKLVKTAEPRSSTLIVTLLSNRPKLSFRIGWLLSFFLLALYFG